MARRVLDPNKGSDSASQLLKAFGKRVVGQDEAVAALVDVVEHHQSGFGDSMHPAGSLLFLGPTGTGKTHVVESMARGLFGSEKAMVKIDCSEFEHSHEIAKLIGSPPGYLGHRETPPLLTPERLNKNFTEQLRLGILLFDEIEKASDALWQLLLGVLDKAVLTLGDNRQVDFSKQVIIMTSNLGSGEMSKLAGDRLGFQSSFVEEKLDEKINDVAINAAKKKFTVEFFNRIDKVVVFKTLTKKNIEEVLLIELGDVQSRLLVEGKTGFYLHTTAAVKKALLEEGYSAKYGARELRRVIRKRIQTPLARMVASGQIQDREVVSVELNHGAFEFIAEDRIPQ